MGDARHLAHKPKIYRPTLFSLKTSPHDVVGISRRSCLFHSLIQISFGTFTPLHPLPTSFSSPQIVFRYALNACTMLSSVGTQNEFVDLSICDTFQDECEEIYAICRSDDMRFHTPIQNDIKQCMTEYDHCLDPQG